MTAYLNLPEGELAARAQALRAREARCDLCPRRCGARRGEGEVGVCGIGARARIAQAARHFGEEPCLVGRGGSGTIFLAGCSLRCVFCQNHDISHQRRGALRSSEAIAADMLALQAEGAQNINWVTPGHVVAALVEATAIAATRGLRLPIVYNSGGYERRSTLKLLDGIVDIYMPDLKFLDDEAARRYLDGARRSVTDYPEVARRAILEMQAQVGDLTLAARGETRRGLLVRHLVMPGFLADSRRALSWLHDQVSPRAAVNVMAQYRPMGALSGRDPIATRPSPLEIGQARDHARALGLRLIGS